MDREQAYKRYQAWQQYQTEQSNASYGPAPDPGDRSFLSDPIGAVGEVFSNAAQMAMPQLKEQGRQTIGAVATAADAAARGHGGEFGDSINAYLSDPTATGVFQRAMQSALNPSGSKEPLGGGFQGIVDQYQQQHPGMSAAATMTGAIASPGPKSLAGTLADAAVTSHGYNDGEIKGGDVLAAGLMHQGLKGVGAVGEKVMRGGKAVRRRGYGITPTRVKEQIKKVPSRAAEVSGDSHFMDEALDTAKNRGVLGHPLNPLSRDPEVMNFNLQAQIGELDGELSSILKSTGRTTIPKPTFKNARRYITEKASELLGDADDFKKLLDEYTERMKKGDASLEWFQKEKRAIYRKRYGSTPTPGLIEFDRAVASDLKEHIENTVDYLAKTGKVSADKAGKIKSINKEMGQLLDLKSSFEQEALRVVDQNAIEEVMRLSRTSGGVGMPMLAGRPGIAAALGGATTRGGQRVIGNSMKGLGAAMMGAANQRNPLARTPIMFQQEQ